MNGQKRKDISGICCASRFTLLLVNPEWSGEEVGRCFPWGTDVKNRRFIPKSAAVVDM